MLFLFSWAAQGYFQWADFSNEAKEHNQSPKVVEFTPAFLSSTFENWQSEFLQLLTFVVLTSFLIHKGSHESKDSDDEMKRQLNRIERKLTKVK